MGSRVETCIVKIGQPDVRNGMLTCGRPAFYAEAGQIVDGESVPYTGWTHVYPEHNADHGAVPASLIG